MMNARDLCQTAAGRGHLPFPGDPEDRRQRARGLSGGSAATIRTRRRSRQLPPQMVNGKPVPQGDGQQLSVRLRRGPVAREPDQRIYRPFHLRLYPLGGFLPSGGFDPALAAFIETYHPSWFTRVGLRYVNAFRRESAGAGQDALEGAHHPGFLGLMGEEDAQEFLKHELSATFQVPGGRRPTSNPPGPAAQGQQSHPRDDRGKGLHAGSRSVYGQQDRARAGPSWPSNTSTKRPEPLPRRPDRHALGRHGTAEGLFFCTRKEQAQ